MADKSAVSFADSASVSYSYESKTGDGKMHSRRSQHIAKLKRRMENMPQRKLLFRPKVYDYWTEGDLDQDIAGNEKLLRDIADKEKRLLARRKQNAAEPDEYGDSDEESMLVKQLEKLKSRKQRETEYRQKLEDDKRKKEEEEMMELEEKLKSEMQNPSIYGWFFTDGYYDNTPFFGLRQDLVEKYHTEQLEWAEKWAKKYPETFTDKFKRFFWPPHYVCGKKSFRTRGSYMDFPEVIADWPREIKIDFEREAREYITNRHDLFGVDEDQKEQDEMEEAELKAEEESRRLLEGDEEQPDKDEGINKKKGKVGPVINLNALGPAYVDAYNWYYDDDEGEFFPKRLGFDVEYYYDSVNYCWRHKKKRGKYKSDNQQTPYDYYYDDTSGQYHPREEFQGIDEIVFDKKHGCFRIHVISRTPRKTKKGKEVFQPPHFKGGMESEVSFDEKGNPFLESSPESKTGKPTDFFFDEEYGKFFHITDLPPNASKSDISWDENGRRLTRKFEGAWRGLTGLSPDDYYWVDRMGKFVPKPARQGSKFIYFPKDGVWRKGSDSKSANLNTDDIAKYFFEEVEGQFKLKDLTVGSHLRYIQGRYSKIWKRVAKPKSELYPEDYYWDTNKKRWLPRAVRQEMLKNAEMLHQRTILAATQPGMLSVYEVQKYENMTKEDFYFDFEEGLFLKKKRNANYVFDDLNKVYTLEGMQQRGIHHRFPHDYYFDPNTGEFLQKEQTQSYVYDDKFHCWKKDNTDLTDHKKNFDEWYFDMTSEEWMKKGKGTGETAVIFDPILQINVKSKSGAIYPDNYFFSDSDGRFFLKDQHEAQKGKYYYDSTQGAWKHKDIKGPNENGLNPRNFYFDDRANAFKMMVRDRIKMDYYFDGKNKIHRHIISSGKTKSGFRPQDFVWNSDFKSYVPASSLKKGKIDPTTGAPLQWEPLREYEKPWIVEAPLRNPDSSKVDSRNEALNEAGGRKSMLHWLAGNNKVEPSTDDVKTRKDQLQKKKKAWEAKF